VTQAGAVETGYASVNGPELYYEVLGSGEPLVLLYGGVVGREGSNTTASARTAG
jgi:hypothetical protein